MPEIRYENAKDCGYNNHVCENFSAPPGYRLLHVGEPLHIGDIVLRLAFEDEQGLFDHFHFQSFTWGWFPSCTFGLVPDGLVRAHKLKWWELPRSEYSYTKEEVEELQRIRLATGRWPIGED